MAMKYKMTSILRADKGAAFIEFAVLSPLMIILFIISIYMGFLAIERQAVTRGVNAAAATIMTFPGTLPVDAGELTDLYGTVAASFAWVYSEGDQNALRRDAVSFFLLECVKGAGSGEGVCTEITDARYGTLGALAADRSSDVDFSALADGDAYYLLYAQLNSIAGSILSGIISLDQAQQFKLTEFQTFAVVPQP